MHSILAARTDYSVGESILTVNKLVDEAKAVDAKAVAITDTMCVTGLIDFSNACKKAGIKPVVGCRLRLVDDLAWRPEKGDKKGKKGRPHHYLTAYALTEDGLKALFRLLSLAQSEDNFFYVPRLSYDNLYAELAKLNDAHLAIVLGDVQGVVTHPQALDIIGEIFTRIGPNNVYTPLVPVDTPYFARINELSLALVGKGLKPLVVRPAYYEKDGHSAAEFMGAIINGNKMNDPWHKTTTNDDFHVVGLGELREEVKKAAGRITQRGNQPAGPIFLEGMKNTAALVDAVAYQWSKQPVTLPVMAPDEYMGVVTACRDGFKERFRSPVFGHKPTAEELRDVYMPRLKYELEVLKKLSFSGYFLLVQDVVQYAKINGILVGPGRGSVGGSLVAYLMGITDCDPLRFDLLFERFINPDRIDLPDADLDFMSARRHEVVDYLVNKYGASRVAGVSNFGRLAAASSIRDVGRIFGLPESEYACSKFVPKEHGQPVSLTEAASEVSEIDAFAQKYPPLWEIMNRLEGTLRNYSQHAAGIVVAGVDLNERAVLEKRKEGVALCFDKRTVEDQGLVKMDILGLNTLDLIALVLDYIRQRAGKKINLTSLPLDDQEVLNNFAAANTAGIFQFESGGMRKLLKELGADGTISFDDITAATALYRPGPMESGMMDSYYRRKQGIESVDYDHPFMEPILRPTYGVMVYQEQVMQVSRTIAGYSAPDADKLRKIMGKKLPEEMKKERGKFVDGCVATIGCDAIWAGQLFDKIEGFAGYGFNKSHSVEYSLISWQAMWLKTHYPAEFFAAALSLLDEDKLPGLIRDAKRFGIDVSMPDINVSSDRFEMATAVRLVIPFNRIKGIGPTTVAAILAARKAGEFKDKQDFLDRVEKRKCNVKHQDLLERVGAFARIEPGQVAANDASRVRDQLDLIPGLISANVPVDHVLNNDPDTRDAIKALVSRYREAHGPNGDADGSPVQPFMGRKASFMLVTDCPSSRDDAAGAMAKDDESALEVIKTGLADAGLELKEVYWTTLVKRMKSGKQIAPSEIATYAPYLEEEIKLLRPPVIVLMGSGVVRHFIPDFKGKASEAAGKVIFSKPHDANFVIGFNPGELFYSPEKQEQVNEIFGVVAELLPS